MIRKFNAICDNLIKIYMNDLMLWQNLCKSQARQIYNKQTYK